VSKVQRHLPSRTASPELRAVVPLSEILNIAGRIDERPSTPRKKRSGMPATRILTSTAMQEYFEHKEQEEVQKQTDKAEKKQQREARKREKAQGTQQHKRKRVVEATQPQHDDKADGMCHSDKENEDQPSDADSDQESDYLQPAATSHAAPSFSRPARSAAEWARARMSLHDSVE
jgi:hypothetical protein